jgi:hypothetical protein
MGDRLGGDDDDPPRPQGGEARHPGAEGARAEQDAVDLGKGRNLIGMDGLSFGRQGGPWVAGDRRDLRAPRHQQPDRLAADHAGRPGDQEHPGNSSRLVT